MQLIAVDPECMGALVTTHKVHLLRHARQMFTALDADAEFLGEVSCVVKRGGQINGLALDTVTAGLAVQNIYPQGEVPGQVLILGAGGAATALAVYLRRHHSSTDV